MSNGGEFNSGEYLASGLPFVTGGLSLNDISGSVVVNFPFLSKEFKVVNIGNTTPLYVAYTLSGAFGECKWRVDPGSSSPNFPVRVNKIHLYDYGVGGNAI